MPFALYLQIDLMMRNSSLRTVYDGCAVTDIRYDSNNRAFHDKPICQIYKMQF